MISAKRIKLLLWCSWLHRWRLNLAHGGKTRRYCTACKNDAWWDRPPMRLIVQAAYARAAREAESEKDTRG